MGKAVLAHKSFFLATRGGGVEFALSECACCLFNYTQYFAAAALSSPRSFCFSALPTGPGLTLAAGSFFLRILF